MLRLKTTIYLILIISLSILSGCSSPARTLLPRSEADQKLLKYFNEELSYPIVSHFVGNTLWVYLPLEERILDYKASKEGPSFSNRSSEQVAVKYIDAKYADGGFNIEYDIGTAKSYEKNYGYSSIYTEGYTQKQNNVLQAIQRAYFDAESAPEFVILVVADIIKGIEVVSTMYYPDLKGALALQPSIPQEEYAKRYISNIEGNAEIIDDKTGKHLTLTEMDFPTFLAKQFVNRVTFKYQRSSFPPSVDTKKEFLSIAAEMIRTYDFKDYEYFKVRDLENEESYQFSKSEIDTAAASHKDRGRLINIKFR